MFNFRFNLMKMKTDNNELVVQALKNGTVIDHIPADKLFKVFANIML